MTRFVYFARRADGTGPIKIGCSHSPQRRVREMSFAHRPNLMLLGQFEGEFSIENALHKRFASSRVEGEWFEPTPELMDLIDNPPSDPAELPHIRSAGPFSIARTP